MAWNAAALPRNEADKLDCFESIRGLAALAVLFGHIIVGFWPLIYNGPFSELNTYPAAIRWIPKTPLKAAYDSQFAVTIFFHFKWIRTFPFLLLLRVAGCRRLAGGSAILSPGDSRGILDFIRLFHFESWLDV